MTHSSFSVYSEALQNLFKNVFNGDVIVKPANESFEYAIKQSENDLKFPFISFYPDNTMYLDNKNNAMPTYTEGMQYQNPMPIYNEDGSYKSTNDRLSKNAEYLYILIGYQIDIWGTNRYDTETLMKELLFWLLHNQQVISKYNGEDYYFTFSLNPEIVDNSDLTTYQTNGKLYRYTCSIQLQAALIRSENYFTVIKPNIKVEELKDNK